MADTATETVLARLEKVSENVHAYLEIRAVELAAPRIRDAEERAEARAARAEREVERQQDLIAELHRQLRAQERRAHRAEHHQGIHHLDGRCPTCSPPSPSPERTDR